MRYCPNSGGGALLMFRMNGMSRLQQCDLHTVPSTSSISLKIITLAAVKVSQY